MNSILADPSTRSRLAANPQLLQALATNTALVNQSLTAADGYGRYGGVTGSGGNGQGRKEYARIFDDIDSRLPAAYSNPPQSQSPNNPPQSNLSFTHRAPYEVLESHQMPLNDVEHMIDKRYAKKNVLDEFKRNSLTRLNDYPSASSNTTPNKKETIDFREVLQAAEHPHNAPNDPNHPFEALSKSYVM